LPRATHTFTANFTDLQNPTIPITPNRSTKLTTSNTFDSWGYVASETDTLGNITTYEYNGPYHQTSKKTFTAQYTQSTIVDNYTYYAANDADVNKRNLLWKIISTSLYKDPENTAVTKSDTVITEFVAYNNQHLPTQTVDSASGDQYGQENT
jgi:YD repeat-containing protein